MKVFNNAEYFTSPGIHLIRMPSIALNPIGYDPEKKIVPRPRKRNDTFLKYGILQLAYINAMQCATFV